MKRSVAFIFFLLLILSGLAQRTRQRQDGNNRAFFNSPAGNAYCDDSELMKRKGNWQKGADPIIYPDKSLPGDWYKQINVRIDRIYRLVRESCTDLSGLEATWYRLIKGRSCFPNGPVPYAFHSLYFSYFCNPKNKTIFLGRETGTWIKVFVNCLDGLQKRLGNWDIHDDGGQVEVFCLAPGEYNWHGYLVYQPYTLNKNSRAIVLTRDGKDPWHCLTQREYLAGLKNELEKQMKDAAGEYDEAAKKIASSFNNSPSEKIKREGEAGLREYLEKKEGYKNETILFFKERINYIDQYILSDAKKMLDQPAMVDADNPTTFTGSFKREEQGGARVIYMQDDSHYKKYPGYFPQFVELYWSWENTPAALNFKHQFEELFPPGKLRALLDR